MIQRIQTVHLLLAIAVAACLYALPLARYERHAGPALELHLMGLQDEEGQRMQDVELRLQPYLMNAVGIALLVVSIFLYRNRPRQARIVGMACLVQIVLQLAIYFTHQSVQGYLGASVKMRFAPWFLLPMVVLAFAFLAYRAIRKDDQLVRDADRLR